MRPSHRGCTKGWIYMKWSNLFQYVMAILTASLPLFSADDTAQTKVKKPNILVIMGDDIGWFNIGAYHRGIMSGKTPNLDKLAREGMLFTPGLHGKIR
jgi:hypothetical protein